MKFRIAGVIVVGLITATAGLIGPWSVGQLVDIMLEDPNYAAVVRYALIILLAGAIAGLGTWAGAVLLAGVLEPWIAKLREDVLAASLKLDSQFRRGDLVSRVADDSREISTAATSVIPTVVSSMFTIVVSAVGMTAVDWRLGLIGLIAIPMYWTTLRVYLPRSGPMYRSEREAFGLRARRLLGGVEGVKTLRAYDATDIELRRIDSASSRARDIAIEVFRFLTWAFSRNNRAEAVVLICILGAGFLLVRGDYITVGAVSAAALIFHRLFGPVGTIVGMFDRIQSAGASLTRMREVLAAADGIEIAGPGPLAAGELRLSGVEYAYGDGEPVLHDVSLSIPPGHHIAIVGATGAGKSTVAKIVSGQLTANSGEVETGGVVSMVSQDVHNFRGTILDNLRVADPDATDEHILHVLSQVGADSWISRLPSGPSTLIGDGSRTLTGVQSQLLALARLQLANPDLVILDEATAEAGSSGAGELDRAVDVVLTGRSALMIAHRLDQAVNADRVIVMDAGAIVESGTHADLVAAGGRYAQLWAVWSEGR